MLEVETTATSGPKWGSMVWFSALLLACYMPILAALVQQWGSDEDLGHAFFVPLVAGYIIWQRRHTVQELAPEPCWWGLALVIYAAAQCYLARIATELFLSRTAFVLSIIGTILFLRGKAAVRALAFPLFLLFFMVPLPTIIYNQITFPLQLLASRLAHEGLTFLDIPALREGNILELPEQRLSVVEACSGIRSLLSLTFLSLIYGHFFERRAVIRVLLFLATVPIAIASNAARVTLTGVLAEYRPELAEGFFHAASGWVIFMVALTLLIAFHRALVLLLKLVAKVGR